MGKVTGFIEFQRLQEAAEDSRSRVNHYKEFVMHLTDQQASQQGARCMDCGIPFCQNGCPVNNIIPDWNDLVYNGSGRPPSRPCTRPTTSPSSPDASVRRLARPRAR
jgi:glutamate synthase (NADPH/NADH) small chain